MYINNLIIIYVKNDKNKIYNIKLIFFVIIKSKSRAILE